MQVWKEGNVVHVAREWANGSIYDGLRADTRLVLCETATGSECDCGQKGT